MFSVLKEIRWILFGLLLLGLAMIFTMRAMAGSPVGWHEDVWPATNAAPYQPMQKIDYGLYGQQTNCVYTNWFWLGTNWFQVTTNGVTNFLSTTTLTNNNTPFCHHVPTGEPTNATYGVELTNWIGVSIIVPTNYCYADLHDLRPPFSQLVNVTPSGGTVFNSNTWTRDVLISGDTDEDFRWAWLRGADQTNIVAGITNVTYWYEREIAPAVNPSKVLGYPFPLYMWSLPLGTADTNWFNTDPVLVSGQWQNSAGGTSQWQYVYAPLTNGYLSAEDAEAMDTVLAYDERRMVVPGVVQLPSAAKLGYGIASNADMLAAMKTAVLVLAPSFVVKEYADSNGDFTAYLAQPITNWNWTVGQQLWNQTWQVAVTTNWVPTITYASDLPHWTAVKTQACDRLNLPMGWVTRTGTVATNVTAGWITGDYTTQWITNFDVSVTYSNSYGGYFDYTPRKRFTTGYPGNGHIVTSHWDYVDLWTSNAVTIITNQLILPCNAGIVEPLDYTETQSVFSVLAPTGILITNATTNVTENTLTVYLRGLTKTNGLVAASNDVSFFSTIFSNAFSGSTSNCVLTNYDVAAGWHEIDYGWDGVRTFLDDLTWQTISLDQYVDAISQPGRWSVADLIPNPGFLGLTAVKEISQYGVCGSPNDTNVSAAVGADIAEAESYFTTSFTNFSMATNTCNYFQKNYPRNSLFGFRATFPNLPDGVDVYNRITTCSGPWCGLVLGLWNTPTTNVVSFWPSCPPSDYSWTTNICCPSTLHTISYTYIFSNHVDSCSTAVFFRAFAGGDCIPTVSADASSVEVVGYRTSAIEVFPESFTNFEKSVDFYVALSLDVPVVWGNGDPYCNNPYLGYGGEGLEFCIYDGHVGLGSGWVFCNARNLAPGGGGYYDGADGFGSSVWEMKNTNHVIGVGNYTQYETAIPATNSLSAKGPQEVPWKYNERLTYYPTPGMTNMFYPWPGSWNYKTVTYTNVPLYAVEPIFDGSDLGFTNMSQYPLGYGTGPVFRVENLADAYHIFSSKFVDNNVPMAGQDTGGLAKGWRIIGARILMKWDADSENGFIYHK